MEEIIFEQNSQIIFFIYLLSGIVGASISIYFFKMHRLFSSSYIFGLMIGFALISFADFFFATTIDFSSQRESFNLFQWINLSCASYGYVFLASVYYFHKSTEKKLSLIIKSIFLSLVPIISILSLVVYIEILRIPEFQNYNEYFRIVNIISIGYVVFSTSSNFEIRKRKLILMPLGFVILLSSQFIRFLFAIEPTILALELSGIFKIVSLTLIIFTLSRNSNKPKNMELKYG